MSAWLEHLSHWLSSNPQWLGAAVFLIALLECLALVGILLPGVVMLFAVAVIAGSGVLDLWTTLLLAFAGGLCGDAISYLLGRRYGAQLTRLPLLQRNPHWLARAELQVQRYGIASLLVGRFIGPLRPMLPLTAGLLKMPAGQFAAVSLVAAAGWALAYLLPGWATGAALRLPMEEGFWLQTGLVCAGLAVLILCTSQATLNGWRHSSLLGGALSLCLLVAMGLSWPHLSALDHGLLDLLQSERQPWLDPWMVLLTRFGDFRGQLLAAVVLCLLLIAGRHWRHLQFALATLLGSALANGALKQAFARARPEVLSEPLSSFSFPSGHSSAAFALCLVLGVLAGRGQSPRLRLVWLLVAGLPALAIALSRVYLGVHWPSDITAGALLASTCCGLSLAFCERQQPLPALGARQWWLILPACLAAIAALAFWQYPAEVLRYRY